MRRWTLPQTVMAALAVCMMLGHEAVAQSNSPDWQGTGWKVGATLYVYGPSIDGSWAFPKRSGSGEVIVDAGNVFDSLNGAFMGALDLHNGRWGLFTDYLYLDVSGSRSGTRDFSIGGANVPGSVTGDLDLGVKGFAWTIAGQYRLQSSRELTMDLLLGARLLDVTPRLSWNLSGELGSLPPASRGGTYEIDANNWDAIIGLKGRYAFGDRLQWYVPMYVDVGTGESSLTWQAAAGLGYAFSWGDIAALWRYVSYDMKSGQPVNDLTFNGPMLGVTFRW